MRKLQLLCTIAVLMLGAALTVQADVPQLINYQGILLDSNGDPVTTTTSVLFAIWNDPTAGDSVWSEVQSVTPDADGLFNILLGSVSLIPDSAFAGTDAYLSIKVDTDPEMATRTRLVSVAYAFRPGTVDGATGGAISGDVAIQSDLDVNGNIRASGTATIGPGHTNTGTSNFVAGKENEAWGFACTVSGGEANSATEGYAAIGGGRENAAADYAFIGGGYRDTASGDYAVIGGGYHNMATHTRTTVAGGGSNSATAGWATVGGGQLNTARGEYATVSGGELNTAGNSYSVVSGGSENNASGFRATVCGGSLNEANGGLAAIGGGSDNNAAEENATIAGGLGNTASGVKSAVGGGWDNRSAGLCSSINGGKENEASGYCAAVGGGKLNFALGAFSAVAGGGGDSAGVTTDSNIAIGIGSTIPGGRGNRASGDYSFAAGRQAKAANDGAFVWADDNAFDFPTATESNFTPAAKMFLVRSTGGAVFVSGIDGSGNSNAGVQLAAGSGSWSSLSDRNLKENFEQVDGADVLVRIAALPISTWNYKAQDESVRHIGPMAQDVYATFGVGEDNRHITTIDADGIALAAIQGLYQQNLEQLQRIEQLEALVQQLLEEKR